MAALLVMLMAAASMSEAKMVSIDLNYNMDVTLDPAATNVESLVGGGKLAVTVEGKLEGTSCTVKGFMSALGQIPHTLDDYTQSGNKVFDVTVDLTALQNADYQLDVSVPGTSTVNVPEGCGHAALVALLICDNKLLAQDTAPVTIKCDEVGLDLSFEVPTSRPSVTATLGELLTSDAEIKLINIGDGSLGKRFVLDAVQLSAFLLVDSSDVDLSVITQEWNASAINDYINEEFINNYMDDPNDFVDAIIPISNTEQYFLNSQSGLGIGLSKGESITIKLQDLLVTSWPNPCYSGVAALVFYVDAKQKTADIDVSNNMLSMLVDFSSTATPEQPCSSPECFALPLVKDGGRSGFLSSEDEDAFLYQDESKSFVPASEMETIGVFDDVELTRQLTVRLDELGRCTDQNLPASPATPFERLSLLMDSMMGDMTAMMDTLPDTMKEEHNKTLIVASTMNQVYKILASKEESKAKIFYMQILAAYMKKGLEKMIMINKLKQLIDDMILRMSPDMAMGGGMPPASGMPQGGRPLPFQPGMPPMAGSFPMNNMPGGLPGRPLPGMASGSLPENAINFPPNDVFPSGFDMKMGGSVKSGSSAGKAKPPRTTPLTSPDEVHAVGQDGMKASAPSYYPKGLMADLSFECHDSGIIVPRSKVCDGNGDCEDSTDEDKGMCIDFMLEISLAQQRTEKEFVELPIPSGPTPKPPALSYDVFKDLVDALPESTKVALDQMIPNEAPSSSHRKSGAKTPSSSTRAYNKSTKAYKMRLSKLRVELSGQDLSRDSNSTDSNSSGQNSTDSNDSSRNRRTRRRRTRRQRRRQRQGGRRSAAMREADNGILAVDLFMNLLNPAGRPEKLRENYELDDHSGSNEDDDMSWDDNSSGDDDTSMDDNMSWDDNSNSTEYDGYDDHDSFYENLDGYDDDDLFYDNVDAGLDAGLDAGFNRRLNRPSALDDQGRPVYSDGGIRRTRNSEDQHIRHIMKMYQRGIFGHVQPQGTDCLKNELKEMNSIMKQFYMRVRAASSAEDMTEFDFLPLELRRSFISSLEVLGSSPPQFMQPWKEAFRANYTISAIINNATSTMMTGMEKGKTLEDKINQLINYFINDASKIVGNSAVVKNSTSMQNLLDYSVRMLTVMQKYSADIAEFAEMAYWVRTNPEMVLEDISGKLGKLPSKMEQCQAVARQWLGMVQAGEQESMKPEAIQYPSPMEMMKESAGKDGNNKDCRMSYWTVENGEVLRGRMSYTFGAMMWNKMAVCSCRNSRPPWRRSQGGDDRINFPGRRGNRNSGGRDGVMTGRGGGSGGRDGVMTGRGGGSGGRDGVMTGRGGGSGGQDGIMTGRGGGSGEGNILMGRGGSRGGGDGTDMKVGIEAQGSPDTSEAIQSLINAMKNRGVDMKPDTLNNILKQNADKIAPFLKNNGLAMMTNDEAITQLDSGK